MKVCKGAIPCKNKAFAGMLEVRLIGEGIQAALLKYSEDGRSTDIKSSPGAVEFPKSTESYCHYTLPSQRLCPVLRHSRILSVCSEVSWMFQEYSSERLELCRSGYYMQIVLKEAAPSCLKSEVN